MRSMVLSRERPGRQGLPVRPSEEWPDGCDPARGPRGSEGITKRKLNLPRVEGGSRRAVVRIWRSFQESLCRAPLCRWVKWAKVARAIDRIEEPDIDGVQEVESLSDELDLLVLMNIEGAREAQVHGLQAVATEGIAGLDAHAVIVAENVAVGIKAGELGEVLGRLQSENQPKLEVTSRHVPCVRSFRGGIGHKAVAHVVGGKRPLGLDVLAVLRDQHEAGVRAIINPL